VIEKQRSRKMMASSEVEPALQATPFLPPIRPDAPLLTDEQRMRLAAIATRVRVAPREVIYREDTPAGSVFIIAEGVVKAFKDMSSGRRWITAFLFPADVFGLAENGIYVRTAQAVTAALLYRFDVNVLIDTLKSDWELQFNFL
jgi:CRP-like cAMP-binding protein